MSKGTWRTAAVVVVLLNCCSLAIAHASTSGIAITSTPQTLSTGTWSLSPSPASVSPVIRDTAAAKGSYFTISNNGSFQTISLTLAQTTVGTGNYTVLLRYCPITTTTRGLWNTSTGVCATGTATTILTNTNASTSSAPLTITLAPTTSFQVQCQYHSTTAGVPGNRTIADSFSVSVAPADLRASTPSAG